MSLSVHKRRVPAALALLFGLLATPARAQTSGANQTHDPSRIIESDGRFYFCSTGGSCASSADGLAWTTTGLRITVPSWSTTYLSGAAAGGAAGSVTGGTYAGAGSGGGPAGGVGGEPPSSGDSGCACAMGGRKDGGDLADAGVVSLLALAIVRHRKRAI